MAKEIKVNTINDSSMVFKSDIWWFRRQNVFSDSNLDHPTTVVYHESILPLPFLICSWDQRTTFIFVKGLLDWPLHNGACWNEAFSAICGNAAEALLKPQCSVHQCYKNRYNLIISEHWNYLLCVMRKDLWLSSGY